MTFDCKAVPKGDPKPARKKDEKVIDHSNCSCCDHMRDWPKPGTYRPEYDGWADRP